MRGEGRESPLGRNNLKGWEVEKFIVILWV
jgi:hypothetical protein